MSTDRTRALTSSRRRRGSVRGSLTKLSSKLGELEGKPDEPNTLEQAQRLKSKLESLGTEFKTHHYSVIELIEEEDELVDEQTILDQHDDIVAELETRIQKLISDCSRRSKDPSSPRNLQSRRLERIDKELSAINKAVDSLDMGTDNTCRLQLHQERIADLRRELAEIRDNLLTMGLDDTDELMRNHGDLDKGIFDCTLRIKQLLRPTKDSATSSATGDSSGVKLPKLDVPSFNGNILNWQTFWEQFCISIHERSHLSDAEKLVYLRQALKDGTARSTIEGLSRSGEHYKEAIDYLKDRFDRPRLIHQTHVREIIEAPHLKDGSGKELRRFHDVMQQHIRALKAMGCEPPGPFLTSLLELKLDMDTSFEWQKHSQDCKDIPGYQKLLDFVNLRAQASEISVADSSKKSGRSDVKFPRPRPQLGKPINSFTADVNATHCVACKTLKHPLYACTQFKAMPHDQKLSILRDNRLCMNCLSVGHFSKECKSSHRCKSCQRPHHTLLHKETPRGQVPSPPATNGDTNPISSHMAMGAKSDVLLMTCVVLVHSPDGPTLEARALLDSASTASFVSERLV